MYSLSDYFEMIRDQVRMDAYVQALPDGDLAHILIRLLPLLRQSDFAAETLIPTLQQRGAGTGHAEAVAHIAQNIRDIEYENAAIIAAEVLADLGGQG